MIWFETLCVSLNTHSFHQSVVDPCCFLQAHMVILVLVDDCLLFSCHVATVDKILIFFAWNLCSLMKAMCQIILAFALSNFLMDALNLHNQHLFRALLISLAFALAPKSIFSCCSQRFPPQHADGHAHKQTWNYQSVIGMLNYLVPPTCPDIAFATHQCAWFCNTPKLSHEQAIKWIACYLLHTSPKGIIYTPDHAQSVHCYVDADFAGLSNYGDAQDPVSVMSCTGYTIHYAGCPLVWLSKLQTEVALSTTEAEYIMLSQWLCDVIPLLNLLEELQLIFLFITKQPIISCTLFKDIAGALQLSITHKTRPCTKRVSLKYHHFHSHNSLGLISILPINTFDQLADIFTKPLPEVMLTYLCFKLLGWWISILCPLNASLQGSVRYCLVLDLFDYTRSGQITTVNHVSF